MYAPSYSKSSLASTLLKPNWLMPEGKISFPHGIAPTRQNRNKQVMSRALCTLAKGARAPRQVNPVTDGEENPLHALHGSKPHPRTGATADFHEAPLHHMGRPQRSPEGPRTLEEGEQLGAIAPAAVARVADSRPATGARRPGRGGPPQIGSPPDRSSGHPPSSWCGPPAAARPPTRHSHRVQSAGAWRPSRPRR